MLKMTMALVISGLMFVNAEVRAQHAGHAGPHNPYAGFERREIKSLSDSDLEELKRGGGWGMALAAELNGAPGPAHLLELKEQIGLTTEQIVQIERIFADMKQDAIAAGARFIEAENALETAFLAGGLSNDVLRVLIGDAERARAELRFIHLSRHLSTPLLLSREQIARYNQLRGYGADPCAHVPQGNDPGMWRRHNNCK